MWNMFCCLLWISSALNFSLWFCLCLQKMVNMTFTAMVLIHIFLGGFCNKIWCLSLLACLVWGWGDAPWLCHNLSKKIIILCFTVGQQGTTSVRDTSTSYVKWCDTFCWIPLDYGMNQCSFATPQQNYPKLFGYLLNLGIMLPEYCPAMEQHPIPAHYLQNRLQICAFAHG